ncbi:hypothetical protein RUND412_006576 [Rhizina undulata]
MLHAFGVPPVRNFFPPWPPYSPHTEASDVERIAFVSICAQPEYRNYSQEELRAEYYRLHPPANYKVTFPQKSTFGVTTAPSFPSALRAAAPFAPFQLPTQQPPISPAPSATRLCNSCVQQFPPFSDIPVQTTNQPYAIIFDGVTVFRNIPPESLTGWEYVSITYVPDQRFYGFYMISAMPLEPEFASQSTHTPKDIFQALAPTLDFPEKGAFISNFLAERNKGKEAPGKWVLAGVDVHEVRGKTSVGILLCEVAREATAPAPPESVLTEAINSMSLIGAPNSPPAAQAGSTTALGSNIDGGTSGAGVGSNAASPSLGKDLRKFGSGSGKIGLTPSTSVFNSPSPTRKSNSPSPSVFSTPKSQTDPTKNPFAKLTALPTPSEPPSAVKDEKRLGDVAVELMQQHLENSIAEIKKAFQSSIEEARRNAAGASGPGSGKKVAVPVPGDDKEPEKDDVVPAVADLPSEKGAVVTPRSELEDDDAEGK